MARLQPLLLLLALFATASASKKYCFNCPMRFCYGAAVVKAGKADVALRGPLCLKDGTRIGIFNTGEPRVYAQTRFGYDRVSESTPSGLKKPFSMSLFKGYPIAHWFPKLGKTVWVSGVGHEHFHYNQLEKIKGKCVILPVTNYQILDAKWDLVRNVNGAGPWHDSCVAFHVE